MRVLSGNGRLAGRLRRNPSDHDDPDRARQDRHLAHTVNRWPRSSSGRPCLLEIVPLVEIGDEPGLGRLPAEQLAGQRARGWGVNREEAAKPAKVLACVLWSDGDDWELEMPSDHLGDVADRYALLGHRVQR